MGRAKQQCISQGWVLVRGTRLMVTSRCSIAEPEGPGWQRAEIPGGTGKDKEDGEIRMGEGQRWKRK